MYVLNVTRKDEDEELSTDSSLEELKISNYDINFEKGKYSYVCYTCEKIKFPGLFVIMIICGFENTVRISSSIPIEWFVRKNP